MGGWIRELGATNPVAESNDGQTPHILGVESIGEIQSFCMYNTVVCEADSWDNFLKLPLGGCFGTFSTAFSWLPGTCTEHQKLYKVHRSFAGHMHKSKEHLFFGRGEGLATTGPD